jgi:Zn-dependent protease with chaperone function/Tfp pilus assembly protein PilF
MTRRWWVALLVISATTWAGTANDAVLEKKFHDDVAASSAQAADEYDQANVARDANKLDEAAAHYRKAIELAPSVDHPHRRLCNVLARQNQNDAARAECKLALDIAPTSAYDKLGYAGMLAAPGPKQDLPTAIRLAHESVNALPDDPSALATLCGTLMEANRGSELADCSERFIAVAPDDMTANLFAAATAAGRGDFALARRRLDVAHAHGLPDADYADMQGKLERAEHGASRSSSDSPISMGYLWIALWVVGIWLGVMLVLLVAGFLLSHSTLRAVRRATAGDTTVREHRLRKLYRIVLALSGLYFYLSVPILLVSVLVAGGGLIFVFVAAGYIPIKLVLLIGIVVIVTISAVLRSLFIRTKPGSLGHRIELADHPRLGALLEDVAKTVDTRPVDAVYLTPGTDMAVTERAGLWASLRGKRAERSLIMGVGLFDGMTQLQLRSVLAHEHGHFRNEDTAGGGFALQVRRSLIVMIVRLAQSGAAAWYNPVWLFLRAYYRVYLGISQGASRLQEVLADRWAIQAYGSDAFGEGYRHVVARSVQFDRDVQLTIKEVVDGKQPLPNLYQYHPSRSEKIAADVASAIDTAMAREPDAFDSHPSPQQRLAFAAALAVARDPQPADAEPIWALFADREALERAMTAEVRDRVFANHGILIAEQPKSA